MKKRVLSFILLLLIIGMPIGYSSDALFSKSVTIPKVEQVVSEDTEEGGITRYVYGGGLVASVKSGEINYYHSDRIGSNRLVSDSSGSIVKEFKSLPFGQEIKNEGIRYAFATGKELDESDLYYFGARYYDQNLGRFTSVDPVPSEPAYQYVSNNPLNLVDPSGMAGEDYSTEINEDTYNSVNENYGDIINQVRDELGLSHGAAASIFGSIYGEQLRRDKGGAKEKSKKVIRFFMKVASFEDNLKRSNSYGVGPGHIHKETAQDIWDYYSANKDRFPENYLESPSESLENIESGEQNIRYMGVLFTKIIEDWKDVTDLSNRPEILSTFYNQGYGSKGISKRDLVPGGVDINEIGFGIHSASAGNQFNLETTKTFMETHIFIPIGSNSGGVWHSIPSSSE